METRSVNVAGHYSGEASGVYFAGYDSTFSLSLSWRNYKRRSPTPIYIQDELFDTGRMTW
jgi:hypothetical protein